VLDRWRFVLDRRRFVLDRRRFVLDRRRGLQGRAILLPRFCGSRDRRPRRWLVLRLVRERNSLSPLCDVVAHAIEQRRPRRG
jgi:hypothetical protein